MATAPSGSTGRAQELYMEESRHERAEQSGFRWMAGITEILRAAATRSATNVDRMLDNWGFPQAVHDAAWRNEYPETPKPLN